MHVKVFDACKGRKRCVYNKEKIGKATRKRRGFYFYLHLPSISLTKKPKGQIKSHEGRDAKAVREHLPGLSRFSSPGAKRTVP